jgi:hypothetical protein
MKRRSRARVLAVLASVLACSPAAASAAEGCSSDSFVVDGAQLSVAVCATVPPAPLLKGAPPPKAGSIALVETFSTKTASFSRTTVLDPLSGNDFSRTIDDVSLAPLGVAKTLHMTIAYKAGTARLEHALLVPGAIALK